MSSHHFRFRVRTLMIAVAVTAVGFWVGTTVPAAFTSCSPLVVPLIGAFWRGRRARDPFSGAIEGGIIDGMIDAFVVDTFMIPMHFHLTAGDWVNLAFAQIIALVGGLYLGVFVGLVVGVMLRVAQDF